MERDNYPVGVWPSAPRQTVQATFPDNSVFEGPAGTPLEAFIRAAVSSPTSIMAAVVNGKLRELNYRLRRDASIIPLSIDTSDGMRIYQRSLSFLLIVATRELFPDASIIVDHSIAEGGYFCEVVGRPNFTSEELARIEARMQEIVQADDPISHCHTPIDKALQLFKAQGYRDKVRLLQSDHGRATLPIYTLRGIHDYFYGYMVPSTRYLHTFALQPASDGFVLIFPTRDRPTELPRFRSPSRLNSVFREHREWMEVMGIEDVASLNAAIAEGRIRELILVSEALHERRIAEIAARIARDRRTRLVLIAGPSSSGKTTFAKRLAVQLLSYGIHPVSIGLDDYFVDREATPRDETGAYDFESLQALDLALFNRQLLQLLDGEPVTLPHFNFQTGRRETGRSLNISKDHIIIVEGIHGLNPDLIPQIPPEWTFRIYVSALTQLNLDWHNRVPTTDTRLIRRIVRDASFRGHTVHETLSHWESVLRGERRNIFPYQDNADEMFNSALLYEMAVLKPLVEPLLRHVDPWSTMEYMEAHRLLSFLSWFKPCDGSLVPDNSLLREFIGGSSLVNFSY